MRTFARRAAALVVAPTLASVALVATPTPSVAAPVQAEAGSAWLADQLVDGLLTYDSFGPYTDTGSTIDAGLAFDELGVEGDALNDIVDAVAGRAGVYTRPADSNPSTTTLISAGATAKTLVLAEATGASTTSFGGLNLVTQLEDRVASTAPIEGRIQDSWQDTEPWSDDFANVVGQALAVRALDGVNSTETDAATDFLLAQQCSAGFFREQFAADAAAPDQSCVDATDAASVDATAQAVLGLASQIDDTDVAAKIAAAGDWLVGFQNADGSFDSGNGGFAFPSNGNSTGLAARALTVAGETTAARRAATWLRAHQATNVGACAPYAAADLGAIAYDDTALAAARSGAIETVDVGEWIRTTVQALPAIALAPAPSSALKVTGPVGYVRGGTKQALRLSGMTPGAPACVTGAGTKATLTGVAGMLTQQVTVPKTTGNRVYTLTTPAGADTVTVKVLGAKKLPVTLSKKRVTRGAKLLVRVRGLAPSESVTVVINGKRVAAGKATANGVFSRTVRATGKPGKRTVVVRGQFINRVGKTTFTVVR